MLELVFGKSPTLQASETGRDPTFGSRDPLLVEHKHYVRVFPAHAGDCGGVAVEHPLVRLPKFLSNHEAAVQAVELLRKVGGPEVGRREDRYLGMGAAHIDGAARFPAVSADRYRVVPRESDPGESQRDRGQTRQDAQVLTA